MRVTAAVVGGLICCCAVIGAQQPPSLFPDRDFPAGVGRINDLAFSPDGRLLAVAGSSGSLAVWDTQSGSSIRQVTVAQDAAVRVAFGGPGTVAVGTERGGVSALNLLTGHVREVARHGLVAITALAVAPDGSMGVSGDGTGDIMIWPVEGGGQAERLREDTKREAIVFLAFVSPTTLVSINKDLGITTWDVPKRRSLRRSTVQLESLGRSAVTTN